MDLELLNEKYSALSPVKRIEEVYKDFSKILLTSSFGTSSVFLLHLFHKVKPNQQIYFLDTTYHFPDTLAYKQEITKLLGLNVVDVLPEEWKNNFTRQDETWKKDPDFCCSINKVEPLEKIKPGYEIWVSGLMSWQSSHRGKLKIFEGKEGVIKFHPLLDVTQEQLNEYLQQYKLPPHPLVAVGYSSVGCTHCTTKGEGRQGRWTNDSKTECGLHL